MHHLKRFIAAILTTLFGPEEDDDMLVDIALPRLPSPEDICRLSGC